ncbi:MAG: type VI secretion system baseplate subunit TssF [Sphingomonadaceae bacterium]
MEKLLPYFERELGLLRRAGLEFAARYPKLAGSLQLSGETCADPHVERLLQGVALMNARTARLLDDGYAGFTEALLEILYPHYLRPFPACSIARFDYSAARPNEMSGVIRVPRGTELKARGADGVVCRFRSVYEVTLAPLRISVARFEALLAVPPALRLAQESGSALCLTLEASAAAQGLAGAGLAPLRVYIDGEAALCAALRDALFMHSTGALVEADGHWRVLPQLPIRAVGFDDGDALLPVPAAAHSAYRLLSEYYNCPEKFNFFDLDLSALLAQQPAGCAKLTLCLLLPGVRSDSPMARLLRGVTRDNLLLACTPVVNLFRQHATPIRITATRSSYPLLPDGLPAAAAEVYQVERVRLLRKTAQGSSSTEFIPYYALRHGETPGRDGQYWLLRRDAALAVGRRAHEYTLALVERSMAPLQLDGGTASVELSCTNRDVPATLRHGAPGGDLVTEVACGGYPIRLLRRPTRSLRVATEGGAHWGLVRHLALNHRQLSYDSLGALLRLYVRREDAVAQRQIDGIVSLEAGPASAWLRQPEGAAYLRGVEMRLTLDEEAFAGSGIHVFAQVLDCFFALQVHLNSFTQLVVLAQSSGKELLRCPPRNGHLTLA